MKKIVPPLPLCGVIFLFSSLEYIFFEQEKKSALD